MDLICDNPYRVLGVYANSPLKDRVGNANKLKAFLKVGKAVDFPLDLRHLLPPLARTQEAVAQADAALTLSHERMRYAQFWFVKATPLDDIAFNHLFAGNVSEAVAIWAKRDNASSLQNRVACRLVLKDWGGAVADAERLYATHARELAALVAGDGNADADAMAGTFLDGLCTMVDATTVMQAVHNAKWRDHLAAQTVKPIVAQIDVAIAEAKAVGRDDPAARLSAGRRLMAATREPLAQLKKLLPAGDLQLQMTADRLGLEVLQCGIDYYNGSDEPDAAHKAMELQAYAGKVVIGQMAKDRCKDNIDILLKIIDNLPPREVFAEDRAIKGDLQQYSMKPEKICHAVTLLNNTRPHLQSMRQKVGAGNAYYLKISTGIVAAALSYVIAEVNDVQNDETVEVGGRQIPISMLIDRDAKIAEIKSTLREAWHATQLMDGFDMEPAFKRDRYAPNRATLEEMCDGLGIPTYTPRPVIQQAPRPVPPRPTPSPASSRPQNSRPSSGSSGTGYTEVEPWWKGCLIGIVVWAVIGCIAGAICVACDGDFAAGFAISLFICLIFSGK